MKNKSLFHVFTNGLLNENPTFRLLLGMCPTLAISTAASSGVGMVISMLRHIIPERVRIPGFIVVIATFVTIIDLIIKAFLPSMSDTLGIYIPLIVVNCIIFARAESFAFKNPVLPSAFDGLGMGLGFTCSLTLLSSVREIIGSGKWFGMQVMPEAYKPMSVIITPSGGFLTLGILLLIVNAIVKYIGKHKQMKARGEIA